MKVLCTGVILAGGLAKRFSGEVKALLPLGGKKILDRIYQVFSELFEEIILVTNDPVNFLEWNLMIGTDLYPVRSSLTGLQAGLFYASNPHVFFSASDTPFLNKKLVETLLEKIDDHHDVIIPETSKGIEPLCAVYSKRCSQRIEHHLSKSDFKIQHFFKKARVKKIPENRLKIADPDLLSFFNINTAEDLQVAQKILKSFETK
ncbi:MAG: molybdenum cofactor guanylyltransferase [Desulfobacterales bacterium]